MVVRLLSKAGGGRELMGDVPAPVPRSSFLRYWTADAISSFGSAVTPVATPGYAAFFFLAFDYADGEK
jgi:hypothetical protein